MLSLRKLPAGNEVNLAYVYFCEHFLKCIVGIQSFNRQMQKHYNLSVIATPSDEAFALLLLENNEYKWRHEFDLKQQKTTSDGHNLKINEEDLLPSKYSSSGCNKQKKGFTKRYNGWTKEGIERFNTLLVKVRQDRKENGGLFDKRFADIMQQIREGDNDGNFLSGSDLTKAGNDLFEDEDGQEVPNDDEQDEVENGILDGLAGPTVAL